MTGVPATSAFRFRVTLCLDGANAAGDSGAGIIDVLRFACGIAGMLYVVQHSRFCLPHSRMAPGASGRILGIRSSYLYE